MPAMRRVALLASFLTLVACTGRSPSAPTPEPAPLESGTAAAVFLTPNSWELPPGGGSLDLVIATAASAIGNVVAAHVPVTLRASSGSLSETEPRTDATGHARVTWTGTSSATITARAGEVEGIATILVRTDTAAPPPPSPNPNPNPVPNPPNPAPPAPNPRPAPPGLPGPAGDLRATIIASPANPDANQTVTFSVVLSSVTGAPIPAIVKYAWDVNGDRLPDRSEASPTATYTTAGPVSVDLEVHTADNRAVQTQLLLNVGAEPALTATLAAAPSSAVLGQTITLTATATPTGNVGILSYDWDVDGNGSIDQTTAANTTTTSYATIGTKSPKVTATGSRGGTATATTALEVTAPALTISELIASGPVTVGAPVTFKATVSAASGAVPATLTFTWDYGNGSEVITGPNPQSVNHIYGVAGQYTVTVTATAPDGRSATGTISVTVS